MQTIWTKYSESSFVNTSDPHKGREDALGHILTSWESNTPPFPVTWFPLVVVMKTDERALDVGIVPTSYIVSRVLVVQRPHYHYYHHPLNYPTVTDLHVLLWNTLLQPPTVSSRALLILPTPKASAFLLVGKTKNTRFVMDTGEGYTWCYSLLPTGILLPKFLHRVRVWLLRCSHFSCCLFICVCVLTGHGLESLNIRFEWNSYHSYITE